LPLSFETRPLKKFLRTGVRRRESGESLRSSPQSKALARNYRGQLPYVAYFEEVVILRFHAFSPKGS